MSGQARAVGLGDDIVSATKFRREMAAYLDRVRQGRVVTVVAGDLAPICVIARNRLAELITLAVAGGDDPYGD